MKHRMRTLPTYLTQDDLQRPLFFLNQTEQVFGQTSRHLGLADVLEGELSVEKGPSLTDAFDELEDYAGDISRSSFLIDKIRLRAFLTYCTQSNLLACSFKH